MIYLIDLFNQIQFSQRDRSRPAQHGRRVRVGGNVSQLQLPPARVRARHGQVQAEVRVAGQLDARTEGIDHRIH